MFYQCDLSSGTYRNKIWLDEKAAKVGKRVKLLDSDTPEIYWSIDKVYTPGKSSESFKQMQDFHRKWHNNI